ncbi:hypothetical protein K4K59_004317 [Colletotrichum sp. SAR11_240]|nr:hypothetical protein K4K59_004317 [Colletotrichum sp. SAR11_240]
MTVGDVTVWIAYWGQIISPVTSTLESLKDISKHFQEAAEAGKILDMEPRAKKGKTLRVTDGKVQFSNVTLKRGDKVVLENFSLDISGGSKIALVGPSGVGKSTVVGLLSGQLVPDSGEILVDGQDINEVDYDSLAAQIGVLEQEPHIYNDTVMENILYGKREATYEEIESACVKACIHNDITRRQNGYETLCGVDGKNFSGGQVQRMTIARLFLKQPAIILVDEGTSALDSATEGLIKRNFARAFEGRTMLIIAHRLSSVRHVDRIIVLGEKGKFVESGTHDTLLELRGKYWEYWQEHLGEDVALND